MGKKFSYLVYGLKVLSDIECPELVRLDELHEHEYDILIDVNQVSVEIHDKLNWVVVLTIQMKVCGSMFQK